MTEGPEQVRAACEAAVAALAVAGFPESSVVGSREAWAGAISAAQQLVNTATAVQDAAIVHLAAIEPEYLDDGTLVELHRAPGHVALDAPAIVSGALSVSAGHAEHRVRAAVRLAAHGPEGGDTGTGLGGLHRAMREGRLDSYRAGVLAAELELAPPHVADAVVAAMEPHLEVEDGPHLRRRCRRVLARISPDLLLERAKRARAGCGLRRWVEEPGVDRWEGTFPSEDAAHAWAAIDALAQRYVKDGTCPTVENARGKALTDLVAGNASIDTSIVLTVPAAAVASEPGDPKASAAQAGSGDQARAATGVECGRAAAPVGTGDLVEVTGLQGSQPVLVSRRWLTVTLSDQRGDRRGSLTTAQCHPVTGALLGTHRDRVDTGDGPTGAADGRSATDAGAVAAGSGSQDAGDIAAGGDTTGTGTRMAGGSEGLRTAAVGGADGYRPSARLARRVRARDRRCRFPACSIAAVFCDLDHVRPWPGGPTDLTNLISLCRRHHRIKQRPGWRVALALDGTVTWTDPTGRTRTTHPVDALTPIVLRDTVHTIDAPATGNRVMTVLPDGPHSFLDFHLEHAASVVPPGTHGTWRDDQGTHHVDHARVTAVLVLDQPLHRRPPRGPRSPRRCDHVDDPPPF